MFVEDDDFVNIKIFYRKINRREYNAYTESEFKTLMKGLKEEEKKEIKELNIKMRSLTWGLYNDLQEIATSEDPITGDRKFLYKVYKENRLKTLIKEWDAKDKNDKAVPVNEKTITHLAPSIAETILRGYDEEAYLSKEEEKN